VLSQVQEDGSIRPIAYASCTLQKHEYNYGVTELEALGVVWAVKHFRSYLYGYRCDIYADHEALKSLLNTPQSSGRLARWRLQGGATLFESEISASTYLKELFCQAVKWPDDEIKSIRGKLCGKTCNKTWQILSGLHLNDDTEIKKELFKTFASRK